MQVVIGNLPPMVTMKSLRVLDTEGGVDTLDEEAAELPRAGSAAAPPPSSPMLAPPTPPPSELSIIQLNPGQMAVLEGELALTTEAQAGQHVLSIPMTNILNGTNALKVDLVYECTIFELTFARLFDSRTLRLPPLKYPVASRCDQWFTASFEQSSFELTSTFAVFIEPNPEFAPLVSLELQLRSSNVPITQFDVSDNVGVRDLRVCARLRSNCDRIGQTALAGWTGTAELAAPIAFGFVCFRALDLSDAETEYPVERIAIQGSFVQVHALEVSPTRLQLSAVRSGRRDRALHPRSGGGGSGSGGGGGGGSEELSGEEDADTDTDLAPERSDQQRTSSITVANVSIFPLRFEVLQQRGDSILHKDVLAVEPSRGVVPPGETMEVQVQLLDGVAIDEHVTRMLTLRDLDGPDGSAVEVLVEIVSVVRRPQRRRKQVGVRSEALRPATGTSDAAGNPLPQRLPRPSEDSVGGWFSPLLAPSFLRVCGLHAAVCQPVRRSCATAGPCASIHVVLRWRCGGAAGAHTQ
jgi:hypothetical protein